MASAAGGPPQRPPAELLGMAHDVGQRPARPDLPPVQSLYVNDVQPTVETEGNITLTFGYHGAGGTPEPIAVTMPFGLFVELSNAVTPLIGASVERLLKQGSRLARVAQAAGADLSRAHAVEGVELQLPQAEVRDLRG